MKKSLLREFEPLWGIILLATLSPCAEVYRNGPEALAISVSWERGPIPLGAPITAVIQVENRSKDPVLFLFNRVVQPGIEFSVPLGTIGASNNPEPFYPSVITGPQRIAPGKTYAIWSPINKFVSFRRSGKYQLDYSVHLEYSVGDESRIARAKGRGEIEFGEYDAIELQRRLELGETQLKNASLERRIGECQALCLMDDPLAVPHLSKLLDSESDTIAGLSRKALIRFHTPEAEERLHRALLDSRESDVAIGILDHYIRNKIRLANGELELLLAKNHQVKLATINYISKMGDASQCEMLKRFINDKNPDLAKAARAVIEKRNPSPK